MTRDVNGPPPIIPYSAGEQKPASGSFAFGSAILVAIFLITFWVVEIQTSNLLLMHWKIRGRYKLRQQFADFVVEFFWSLLAAIVVYFSLRVFGPRTGRRLHWKSIVTIMAGAVVYSWARWAFDFTSIRLSDGVDFLLAMLLAAMAGCATSWVRSKSL